MYGRIINTCLSLPNYRANVVCGIPVIIHHGVGFLTTQESQFQVYFIYVLLGILTTNGISERNDPWAKLCKRDHSLLQ